MISTNFYFNGESNLDYGVYLIRDSNSINMPYIPNKTIQEDFPTSSIRPFFYSSKYQQYSIKLKFSTLTNDLTDTKLKEIAGWLFQSTYKEFYNTDNTEKIYYLIATGEVPCFKNVVNEGFFEVTFKSFYPYALTSQATPIYAISGSDTIAITNDCNIYTYYRPEMEITVGATSSITLVNTSDSNRTTTLTGLTNGEVLYVDNEKQRIISDTQTYPLNNFNKIWLRLIQGSNSITVTGSCSITFRTQFPIFA